MTYLRVYNIENLAHKCLNRTPPLEHPFISQMNEKQ